MDNELLEMLFRENDIMKICNKFDEKCTGKKDTKLLLFSVNINPNMEVYRNMKFYNYSIMGISDYEKMWVLDSKYPSSQDRELRVGRTINLDLNILTKLKNIVKGKNFSGDEEFIEYLSYLKINEFNLNMSFSLMERISKQFKRDIWSDYILSYAKYDFLKEISKENLVNVIMSESHYNWAKEIEDASKNSSKDYEQYKLIQCLIMKAFLLRQEKRDETQKIIDLVKYSIETLRVYSEFELYLLSLYLRKDDSIKKTFEKAENVSKDTISRIKNISWDIFHIRLMENLFIKDLREKDEIILEYLGTEDKGIQDVININPIKFIGLFEGQDIRKRTYSIFDVLPEKESEIDMILKKHQMSKKEKNFNFDNEITRLEKLISCLQNRIFPPNEKVK